MTAAKKAGEAVASKVVQAAKAVSKAEAATAIPAKESTKTTMMPWKGWVDRSVSARSRGKGVASACICLV